MEPDDLMPFHQMEEVTKGLSKQPARVGLMVSIPLAALRSGKDFCSWIKGKFKGGSNR